jgi:hypothetical protein
MNIFNHHDAERHQRLRELLDQAAGQPESEWEPFLERECPGDCQLQGEALRLLKHGQAAGAEGFLGLPARTYETDAGATYVEPVESRAETERLGKYQIVKRFGGPSGQGAAYLAFDPDLARHVVLKRYHRAHTPADRSRMFEEGRSLSRIKSPYVAQCFGIERLGEEPFLVVQHVPGRNLAEVRRDGPLEVKPVVRLLAQLAEGVAAVHAAV